MLLSFGHINGMERVSNGRIGSKYVSLDIFAGEAYLVLLDFWVLELPI
jgi:hypothetical protein